MFVHRQAFLIRGVNRDCAPAQVGIHEPSHVEVDKHDQLSVAKRMDTKSSDAMGGSKAKVGDRVHVPAACHELFEDAQRCFGFHLKQAVALLGWLWSCCGERGAIFGELSRLMQR